MSFADAGSIRASIDFDARGLEAAVNKAMKKATAHIDNSIDQGMDRVEGRMKSGFRKVGAGIIGLMSLDVVAQKLMQAGTYIADLGRKTEQSLNTFQAVTKATGAEMEAVSAKATELGNDISLPGVSAVTASEAMTELAKSGLSVEESMTAAKGTLQLAAAAQIDAAQAAEIQGAALNAFGLAAKDAGRVADVLANSANASAAEIGDTADALAQAGAVAKSAGFSLEETTTILSQFANAGIKGSDAGTLLKTMLMRLQAPTGQAASVMEDLGINVFDANGEMVSAHEITRQLIASTQGLTEAEKAKAMTTIFGADAVRGVNVLLEQGIKVHEQTAAAIGREGSAAELAAAKTKGLTGAVSGMIGILESVAVQIYQEVSPALNEMLRGALEELPGVLEDAGTYAKAFFSALEPAARIVGQFIAAAKPGVVVAFKVALGALLGVVTALSVPLSEVAALLEEHPGIIKGIIGPLVAATLAYKAFARAVAAGQSFRTKTVDAYGASVGRLQDKFRGATGAVSRFRIVGGGLVGAMGGPWGVAIGAAVTAIGFFTAKSAEARARTDALKSSLDSQTGALTKNSRAWIAKRLREEGALAAAQKLGIALPLLTDAVMGQRDAVTEVNTILDRYRKTTAEARKETKGMSGGIVGGSVPALGEEAVAAGKVKNVIGELTGTVKQATREKKLETRATKESAKAKDRDSISSARLDKIERQLSRKVDTTSRSLKNQTSAAKATTRAIEGLNDASIKGISNEIDFAQATDDLTKQIKQLSPQAIRSGKALDISTQAGRDTMRAFIDVATASAKVEGGMKQARAQIYGIIRPMVQSDAKAHRLTSQFFKLERQAKQVPGRVSTTVTAPGLTKTYSDLVRLSGLYNGMDGRVVRTHIINTTTHVTERLNRAAGGPVFGPGTGTSDSIPAMLSNGEHVLTAREVDAAGGHGNIIRLRQALLDGATAFAKGGAVNGPRPTLAPQRVADSEMAALVNELSVSVGSERDLPEALDETLFHLRRIKRGGRYATV